MTGVLPYRLLCLPSLSLALLLAHQTLLMLVLRSQASPISVLLLVQCNIVSSAAMSDLGKTVKSCTPVKSWKLIAGLERQTTIIGAKKLRSSCHLMIVLIVLFTLTLLFLPVDFHIKSLRFFIWANKLTVPFWMRSLTNVLKSLGRGGHVLHHQGPQLRG